MQEARDICGKAKVKRQEARDKGKMQKAKRQMQETNAKGKRQVRWRSGPSGGCIASFLPPAAGNSQANDFITKRVEMLKLFLE